MCVCIYYVCVYVGVYIYIYICMYFQDPLLNSSSDTYDYDWLFHRVSPSMG